MIFYKLIIYGCIEFLFTLMDHYNFREPHDNGYFSLKTIGGFIKFDIWHDSKKLARTLIIIGLIIGDIPNSDLLYWIGIFALVGLIIHIFFYHGVWKGMK